MQTRRHSASDVVDIVRVLPDALEISRLLPGEVLE